MLTGAGIGTGVYFAGKAAAAKTAGLFLAPISEAVAAKYGLVGAAAGAGTGLTLAGVASAVSRSLPLCGSENPSEESGDVTSPFQQEIRAGLQMQK